MREDRSALHAALRVITETFITFALACMEYGASGIFYATNGWASRDLLTPDQYREFGEQYDLEFLDAMKKRAKFNILHNCGSHVYFDQLASYPVHALNWDISAEGNPGLLDGRKRSGKAVMGGVDQRGTLKSGSPDQVQQEVARAIEETAGRHLLLAPGCSVSPQTPAQNLEAVRTAVANNG
jgi:uroporphyrinogen decarboxylase